MRFASEASRHTSPELLIRQFFSLSYVEWELRTTSSTAKVLPTYAKRALTVKPHPRTPNSQRRRLPDPRLGDSEKGASCKELPSALLVQSAFIAMPYPSWERPLAQHFQSDASALVTSRCASQLCTYHFVSLWQRRRRRVVPLLPLSTFTPKIEYYQLWQSLATNYLIAVYHTHFVFACRNRTTSRSMSPEYQ